MLFVRCPFCHKLVFRFWYASHEAKHTARLPDGQMKDHVTVHPKGRYPGSLRGVPQAYLHPRCGVVTRMPEEIIRSYLVNPFLYGGGSFCCGCNDYVPEEELFWHETGQSLAEYNRGLKEDYIRRHGEPPPAQEQS
jgi:hypothetical protein